MDISHLLIQSVVVAIVAGVAGQIIAEKIRMPSIVILMIFGILLGPEFLNIVIPKYMGNGLEVLISLAVALILFEGGMSLDLDAFREVNQSVRNMVTVGMIIMIIGSSLVAHYGLNLSWHLSALFGAFMSITGLTVVNPILQRIRAKKEIATILKGEGILSNPIGAFAAVTVLEVILASSAPSMEFSFTDFCYEFILKLVVGSVFGFIMGWLLGKFLARKYISEDLSNLVLLAAVFGTFFLSNLIEENTGILAVVLAGFAVQREHLPQLRKLQSFGGQLSILFISILFILISANLDLNNILRLGIPGIIAVLIVMFVVRPLSIFLSNIGLLSIKDKLFLSWVGPKGIVSASVASLFSIILVKNGFEDAVIVESMVFLTILITVIFQGITARTVAKLCDVLMKSGGVIIIGANALGRTLGTAFKEIGKEVMLIDNNVDHRDEAKLDGLETVVGNCLDPAVLESANVLNAETIIATTANSEVNFITCQMAKEEYNVQNVYPTIGSPDVGVHHKAVEQIGGNLAYAKTVSIEDWKDAIGRNKVKIVEWTLEEESLKSGKLAGLRPKNKSDDDWLPLILKRKDGYFFAHAGQEWAEGDTLICLFKEI